MRSEIETNYSVILAVASALHEGRYFEEIGRVEYCPLCGWRTDKECPHTPSEQTGCGFRAALCRSRNGREDIFVLLIGAGADQPGLIPIQWDEFRRTTDLVALINTAIRPYHHQREEVSV